MLGISENGHPSYLPQHHDHFYSFSSFMDYDTSQQGALMPPGVTDALKSATRLRQWAIKPVQSTA